MLDALPQNAVMRGCIRDGAGKRDHRGWQTEDATHAHNTWGSDVKMARMIEKQRARNVETLLYPEDIDVTENETVRGRIMAYVEGLRVPAALSPLHDKDQYTLEDVRKWIKRNEERGMTEEWFAEHMPRVGQIKKPHYHLMITFKGNKTREQLTGMLSDLCDVPVTRWEVIEHWDSALRYLAHMDSKDKYPYNPQEIVGFGGLDLSPLVRTDEISRMNAQEEIRQEIRRKGIRYYNQLMDWAYSTGEYDYIACVSGKTSMWCQYLNGRAAESAARRNGRDKEKK